MTITHIKMTTTDSSAWCGAALGTDFYFKSSEDAALNGRYNEIPKACDLCTQEIISCLENGRLECNKKEPLEPIPLCEKSIY